MSKRKVIQICVTHVEPVAGEYNGWTDVTRLYDDGVVIQSSREWKHLAEWQHEIVPEPPWIQAIDPKEESCDE